MRRGTAVWAVTLFALLPLPAGAKPLRTLSLRELVIHADNAVLAEPLETSLAPRRFKVREVLRGGDLRPGDTLTLDDLGPHDLKVYEEGMAPPNKPHLRPVEQALIFLGPNRGSRAQPRFEPVSSGLRFWTQDRALLVPEEVRNPGNYVMAVHRGADWAALVQQARADGVVVGRLMRLKELPPSRGRARALLDWVERYRYEFGAATPAAVRAAGTGAGWGDLETQVFQWVLEAAGPEDCWSAVRLYAELNRGNTPPLPGPVFGSREGRALLRSVALAADALEGDRVRALSLLGDSRTLWAGPLQGQPGVQPADEKEQAETIDRLLPLLAAPSAPLRASAAVAVRHLSAPEVLGETPRTRRALPALERAYRAEAPGAARDALAEAVCAVGGPGHWHDLTGNPPGLLACLRDLERHGKQVRLWLNMRPCGLTVYECPTLVLERLDKAGKVAQTKEAPLPVVNLLKPWAEGWDGGSYLLAEVPADDLAPGTWRVTVRGTAGKGAARAKWTSEPGTFTIEAPEGEKDGPPLFK